MIKNLMLAVLCFALSGCFLEDRNNLKLLIDIYCNSDVTSTTKKKIIGGIRQRFPDYPIKGICAQKEQQKTVLLSNLA